jgi:hypothetical protein
MTRHDVALLLGSVQSHARQSNRLPAGEVLPLPPELEPMASAVPACFERETWVMWLSDTWHKPLKNARECRAMRRGVVPDFCAECTHEHSERMAALGRCERAAGLLEKSQCKSN